MRFLAALLACFALSARATTPTTDFSDLWYNQNEEGWGMNIVQQNEVLFVTLFVYAPNGSPTWLVAPATQYQGATQDGIVVFTGPLYVTTGPYFGAVFNESLVTNRQVGTLSFAAGQIAVGAVSYTVDGVQVTKNIERQTWRLEDVGGTYVGASSGVFQGCGGNDGPFESFVTLAITHQGGSAITLRETGDGYECVYQGTYTQRGRLGGASGTGTCTSGTTSSSQTFTASEIQGGIQGVTMRFFSQLAGACSFSGRLGGIRR